MDLEQTQLFGFVATLSTVAWILQCLAVKLELTPPLRERDYVALKIYIKTPTQRMNREIVAYSYLRSSRSSHAGRPHVRELLIRSNLYDRMDLQRLGGKPTALPQDMVRSASRYLLQALDYLHTEVNITHCGRCLHQAHRNKLFN